MPARFKFLGSSFAEHFQRFDTQVTESCSWLFRAKFFCFEVVVVEAVEKEICQIRNDSFCAFRFQQLYQVVVGGWQEFYQDFAYNADLRLFHIGNRKVIKLPDNAAADFFEFAVGWIFTGKETLACFVPFFVKGISRAFCLLIRAHTIETAHEDITKYQAVNPTNCQPGGNLESGILFQSA